MTSDTQRNETRADSSGTSARTLPCPYCGTANSAQAYECGSCGGVFEPLSRQATQNAMGPWFIRDESNPFSPGCAYETLRRMVARGKVRPESVLRGPTTNQFWMYAKNVPGVAILFGVCHTCNTRANPEDFSCNSCGSVLSPATSRDGLGLTPIARVNKSAAAISPESASSIEATKALTLEGFVPVTSPADVRNIQTVSTTLSPYLEGSAPSRPEQPAAPRPIQVERAANPVRVPKPDQADAAPAQQATTRRLRNQLKGARTINIILIAVCGLLAAGLIMAMVIPSETPAATTDEPATQDATPAPVAPAPIADDASVSAAIENARTLANAGDSDSIRDAIASLEAARATVTEAGGSPDGIDVELESLNAKLDAIRLREALK